MIRSQKSDQPKLRKIFSLGAKAHNQSKKFLLGGKLLEKISEAQKKIENTPEKCLSLKKSEKNPEKYLIQEKNFKKLLELKDF